MVVSCIQQHSVTLKTHSQTLIPWYPSTCTCWNNFGQATTFLDSRPATVVCSGGSTVLYMKYYSIEDQVWVCSGFSVAEICHQSSQFTFVAAHWESLWCTLGAFTEANSYWNCSNYWVWKNLVIKNNTIINECTNCWMPLLLDFWTAHPSVNCSFKGFRNAGMVLVCQTWHFYKRAGSNSWKNCGSSHILSFCYDYHSATTHC